MSGATARILDFLLSFTEWGLCGFVFDSDCEAYVFGRIPVANVAGSDHRRYLMERRGDGVSIIRTETREATGLPPEYEVVDGSSLILRIPAAKLELVPADATVMAHSRGEPLADIEVLTGRMSLIGEDTRRIGQGGSNPAFQPTASPLRGLSAADIGRSTAASVAATVNLLTRDRESLNDIVVVGDWC